MNIEDIRKDLKDKLEKSRDCLADCHDVDGVNLKFLLNERIELHHLIVPSLQHRIRSYSKSKEFSFADEKYVEKHKAIYKEKRIS